MAFQIPKTSSYLNEQISLTKLQGIIPGDPQAPDPINLLDWYDPLDFTVNSIFNGNIPVTFETYSGEPITTLSYRITGNTTFWWVILMFNGFLHPDEIPIGTVLRIPSYTAVMQKLTDVKSQTGKIVKF